MTTPDPFPPLPNRPAPPLSRDEVVRSLMRVMALGYPVHRDGEKFVIGVEEDQIEVVPQSDARWAIASYRVGIKSTFGYAETEAQLGGLLDKAAGHLGNAWPSAPTAGRLYAEKPASNLRTISELIGSATIEAVFDPYLENSSLVVLLDILSFGQGGLAGNVRLLSSTKMTKGSIPRFSRSGVQGWATQMGIVAEARVVPESAGEHRRFLLLSGNRSLILGPSLNSIHKNEAVHVESDAEDRPFFDGVWAAAAPL